jgi:PAS domain S-box-containing protein
MFVLVAHPETEYCYHFKSIIIAQGHNIHCLNDKKAIIDSISDTAFDMVIMDSALPEWDEITQRIKSIAEQRHQWLPILLVAEFELTEVIERGTEVGIDDFMQLPIKAEWLKAKMSAFSRSISLYNQLQASETYSRAVSEGVLDAIVTMDQSCHILSANRATERMFGYSQEELIGQNVNILIPEPLHSQHDQFVANYCLTGQKKVIGTPGREVPGRKKNGEIFHLRLGVSDVVIKQKRVFIGLLSDISVAKKREEELTETTRKLNRAQEEIEVDLDMARSLLERLIERSSLDNDPQIAYHIKPALRFSGDLILAQRTLDNRLFVMVADATGHGLSAAVSSLPVVWVFYGMIQTGCDIEEIVAEINRRMKQSMPLGRFVAAHMAMIDYNEQILKLWSGGMPSAWLIDDNTGSVTELPSQHPALGIFDIEEFNDQCMTIDCSSSSRLLLMSDGVNEAQYEGGSMLGEDKINALIQSNLGPSLLNQLISTVENHLQGNPSLDDISLASILL